MDEGFLDCGDGRRLAWRRQAGRSPAVVFLHGFGSDMAGSKAEALAAWCARHDRAFLRFDASGHGASAGHFEDGTIGLWRDDALAAIDRLTDGRVVLVGSSMGGWLALLVALLRPARVAGLVGIAAAPDFTEDLMWEAALPAERARLLADGFIDVPSPYGPAQRITRALIEDGRRHLLLRAPVALDIPVRLLHGQRDADVPWETALRLAGRITGADVVLTLIKDGDHRLSREADCARLCGVVGDLLGNLLADFLGEDGG